jgi:cell division protein FtsQ
MVLLVLAMLVSVGVLGWSWLNELVFRTMDVSGNVQSEADELIAAARVDTGIALFGIDPALIADRVQRHPWVRTAEVTRLPPSTLSIKVRERDPVVLVIDANGIPSDYLDAEGYRMPVTDHSSFDLPLLMGAELPPNPTQPIESPAVADLLEALAQIGPATDVLISSFVVDASGQIALRTAPIHGQGSVVVRLGRREFDKKLRELSAFWDQAVVTRPDTKYEWIDLRFDSQIVTREASGT